MMGFSLNRSPDIENNNNNNNVKSEKSTSKKKETVQYSNSKGVLAQVRYIIKHFTQ